MTTAGYEVYFGSDENVLKLILMLVAQHCEYSKNHLILYLMWVNCVLSEYYLNKVVKDIGAAIAP